MTSSARAAEETSASPSRRRDARANRDRLLTEARAMIAEAGVDASLEEIARRAEVGVATLYRNFPTRDDLVRALYDIAFEELGSVREEIEAAPTAWQGIVIYIERVAEWLVADPSLPPILKRLSVTDPTYRPEAHFETFIATLVKTAKSDGDLRPDVEPVDLAVLVTMVGSLGSLGDGYAAQWRRQLTIVIDGLRTPGQDRTKLPGRPLSAREFQTTVHGLSRRARRRTTSEQ